MTTSLPLLAHFRPLKDPRVSRRRLHSLENILFIALCAVVAGANDFLDIAVFASKRLDWLSRFLDLPNGVPSHDTFERVFDRLDSKQPHQRSISSINDAAVNKVGGATWAVRTYESSVACLSRWAPYAWTTVQVGTAP